MATLVPIRGTSPSTTVTDRLSVLLVTEAAGGGAGRHVADLAEGLKASGHRVTIAYAPERLEPSFEARLDSLREIRAIRLDMRRQPGPWDIRAGLDLRNLCRREGPFDIVHAHSSKAGALARLACHGVARALIYTPHALFTLNPMLGRPARLLFGTLERVLSHLCHAIICVSEDERRHAVGLGIPEYRLHVVPNGIDPEPPTDREAVRTRYGIDTNDFCVGFVGRLDEQKAVSRLITEFERVSASRREMKLLIIGAGPEAGVLRELVSALGLADRVIMPGRVDGSRAMAAFDMFALPSRYEGLPYVLLEALAASLPVVATKVGGVALTVHDGANGFVVAEKDFCEFGDAMARLNDDPSLHERMARESRALSDEFSIEAMIRGTLAVYTSSLDLEAQPVAGRQPVSTSSYR